MEMIEVEAVEDRSRPEGGHAVVLLRNVAKLPETMRFRLRPLDVEGLAPEARRLFEEEHAPLSVSETEDGVALSIGPELAGSPHLLPGTVMEIVIAEEDLRGEFLWPSIAPLARPKRRHIMTRRAPGNSTAARVAPLASEAAVEVTVKAQPADEPPAIAPSVTVSPAVPVDRFDFSKAAPSKADEGDGEEARPERRSIVVRQAELRGPAVSPTGAAASTKPVSAGVPEAEVEIQRVPGQERAGEARPKPAPSTGEAQEVAAALVKARAGKWGISYAGVAVMTAAAVVLSGLAVVRFLDLAVVGRSRLAELRTGKGVQQAPAVTAPQPSAAPRIYDAIAAGPRSPRGVDADTISPAKALQMAHGLLHGAEAERDPEEAIYWLKRYLASTAGTEHARIALTQLGTAYSQPVRGTRDMASARIAWELAGALGDPVAMCFLGAIHDGGIGVAVDPAAAADWFRRAAAAGGTCASANRPATRAPR